nr:AGE family epimerase/isomerase [Auraticoccus cholistanensis]
MSEEVARFLLGATRPPGAPAGGTGWVELLDQLLVVSVGRPWRPSTPGLQRPRQTSADGQVTVTGTVGGLGVTVGARLEGDRLRLDLAWRNDGSRVVEDLAVGLQLLAPPQLRVTIPQVVYHDNPSADPDRVVPHVSRGGFVTELHRLPIPGVALQHPDGPTVSLVVLPDPDEDADGRVRYGSLGAVSTPEGTRALALSGVVAFDGEPDVTYVHKAVTAPTDRGYRRLEPGEVLAQHLLVDRGDAVPGHGFRELVRIGREVFDGGAQVRPGPLGRREHTDLRLAALEARACTDGEVAGYLKFPSWGEPRRRPGRAEVDFLYGWTGQCLRLAWCEAWVGLERDEPQRVARARAVCDFYLAGSATAVPGLRLNSYVHDERRWQGLRRRGTEIVSARALGETLCDLADLVTLFRHHRAEVPQAWVTALREGADFVAGAALPSGLLPLGWLPDGTPADDLACAAGLPAVLALARAAAVTGERRFLDRAVELAEVYHEQHDRTFDRPFAHSTLDAACEDKEAGMACFELLLELHEQTGDQRYLRRAEVVADWLLTWVYHWNPVHDRGTPLRERGFDAVGWPGVSVQNHHLDVFFPTFDLWRLGRLTGAPHLVRWAGTILDTMGQGVCTRPGEWGFDVVGEQGEAFFVTEWQDRGRSNTWNPSWVIALPLTQLLRFSAVEGVDAGAVEDVADDVRGADRAEAAVLQP